MRRQLDVSHLTHVAFGPRDPLWWGVMCLIAIETTMLALLAVSYIYVQQRTSPFPPTHMGTTIAWVGTVELAMWVISAVPQTISSKHAIAGNLRGMRTHLLVATLLAAAGCALRIWVFHLLPFRWDDHAYGSVVWGLLAIQWVHGLTGVGEDGIYVVLMFVGPVEDKHRVDIEVSTPLIYFVVAGGLLVWALLFLPLLLGGGR